jgi:hypothetical protein
MECRRTPWVNCEPSSPGYLANPSTLGKVSGRAAFLGGRGIHAGLFFGENEFSTTRKLHPARRI